MNKPDSLEPDLSHDVHERCVGDKLLPVGLCAVRRPPQQNVMLDRLPGASCCIIWSAGRTWAWKWD